MIVGKGRNEGIRLFGYEGWMVMSRAQNRTLVFFKTGHQHSFLSLL